MEAYREAFRQKVRTISYSVEGAPADISVREKTIDPESGFLFLKVAFGKRIFEHRFPLFGLHHAQNLIAATALASLAGIQLEEARGRFDAIRPALHRGEIFRGAEDRILIDESYNSNPTALGSSLVSLSKLNPSRRRVMVLGEMWELETFAERLHREAGEHLARLFSGLPFVVVGVGPLTRHLIDGVKSRLPQADCRFVPDTPTARELVKGLLKPHDLLFIKGSRGVKLDQLAADYRTG
jgi:UDP-N-acetylmuramoyl-tripeptide--D-alanyl-D-alanine ligase